MFEIDSKTCRWLLNTKIILPSNIKQLTPTTFQIKDPLPIQFQNGIKISFIIIQIFKKYSLPIPDTLNHLKLNNTLASYLYNWNIINDALKKVNFQIDSQTKNFIINGDRIHLAMIIRKLITIYQNINIQDSLDTYNLNKHPPIPILPNKQQLKQSLTLSKSQQPQKHTTFNSKSLSKTIQQHRTQQPRMLMATGDLLQFIVNQLMHNLKLTMKQALALLSDNNKYLAHVLVKGIKGQFADIQLLLQKFYSQIDYVVQKMIQQNDMCYYFLQIIKPCLLSKNQQIAQWGCRILTKVAHQLAGKEMLPLAYDWFVQQAGGLSTTILALARQPKLSQSVVSYILQFSRYNVTQLFTIELRKITNNDNLNYVKFMLLIFDPLAQSKISAEQLLQSGAIDYWIQISLKGAQNDQKNSKQLRIYCIQFLIKLWRSYPAHIQQTLDQVTNIMNQIKKGIRDDSQIMRFTLMQMMFDLLDQFACKKNPYASIVYKKITFLFIQNHQQITMRQFILRNLQVIFQKYQSIPVQIFLQPFIKQIKVSQNKSYLLNIFDLQFINTAVKHRKLKITIALQLFDLLAKIKLNNYSFSLFATDPMQSLISRFLNQQIFLQYSIKLVKICLAMFYSTLKQKKPYEDQQRLQAQKRAQIINLIIYFIQKSNPQLNEQIKNLTIHVKVQILNKLGIQHKGIQRILGYFIGIQQAIQSALENYQDQFSSNATPSVKQSKANFHLPKIQSQKNRIRDQTASQQSSRSNNTKYSQSSKQQFPSKDYSKFISQEQQKFIKQNGLTIKKKSHNKKYQSHPDKQPLDPKIQQQLQKIKYKKQEQQKKKHLERQSIEKRKQLLKYNIQKQLEYRNLKQGVKGLQKNVQAQLLFQQHQINQNLLQQPLQSKYNLNLDQQQHRDQQSINIILKKYTPFIKKLFIRYSNINGAKRDISQAQNPHISQVLLLRLCKQKGIQKSKNTVIQLMKQVNNKNINTISMQNFFKFLQSLCISLYIKQKCPTKILMGDHFKKILQKMSQGQNFKLDQDDDLICHQLTQKIHYNPHLKLPQNFKKIYQPIYKINQISCSYPVRKALNNQAYINCFQIVHELLHHAFKVNILEEQVRFLQENRVVHKKQVYIPPKPILKKEKQQSALPLLDEKQTSKPLNRSLNKTRQRPLQKSNTYSRSRSKIINQVERKKQQQQQQQKKKKQLEEQLRRLRAIQVKKKLQKQLQQRQLQRQKKQEQKKLQIFKQQEKQKKIKQKKIKYQLQQKQKLQSYKKLQSQIQQQNKLKFQQQKLKQQQQKKIKYKSQFKKQQQKRKQQYQKLKKQKQLNEDQKNKQKQNQQKKKQTLKKYMMKKISNDKSKSQVNKIFKQIIDKIYNQPQIQDLSNNQFKQQLKAIFNYARQYNQYKIDKPTTNTIQQKGWINICQLFNICDANTASKTLKLYIKQKSTPDLSLDDFKKLIFQFAVKSQIDLQSDNYDLIKHSCQSKYKNYLLQFKLPKSLNKLKQYFINLKTQNQLINKKKQQLTLINPNGQQQTWQLKQ